jgi:hypothetical protein
LWEENSNELEEEKKKTGASPRPKKYIRLIAAHTSGENANRFRSQGRLHGTGLASAALPAPTS